MQRPEFQDALRILQEMLSPAGLSEGQLRKRQRIIEASTGLFLRHGYRRTSVDEIARESHVAKGTVYTYFKNKAELLVHAIASEKQGFVERLAPLLDQEQPGEQRLRTWLGMVFEIVDQMPLTSSLMRGDREVLIALEEIDPSLGDFFVQQQHAFIDQMIAEAAGDARFTGAELGERGQALMAIAYSANFIMDERVRGGIEHRRFAHLLADILVDGIAHRSSGAD
ncbi:MAG: helix-turn-helix domain containing protein [Deltaproteobacteria bacterium]|nr:helix-turn-helix domain containing protein [Deltaproteobacteria bacterium]